MRNARHVIAVTIVATAICADRMAPAAPTEAPTSHIAGRLFERLSVNLRLVVPAARLYQPRRFGLRPADDRRVNLRDLTLEITPISLSPFQFRLPPPVI